MNVDLKKMARMIPGIGSQQGTTKTLLDTVVTTGGNNLSFFTDIANKSQMQTNWAGKLQERTAMVLKNIYLDCPRVGGNGFLLFDRTQMTIRIGNNEVISKMDFSNASNGWNPNGFAIALIEYNDGTTNRQTVGIRLYTELILPPLTNLEIEFDSVKDNALGEESLIYRCYARGYSKQLAGTY